MSTKYLDFEGLSQYDEKIKNFIILVNQFDKDRISRLESLVGDSGTPEISHLATQEDVDAGLAENIGDKVIDVPASSPTGIYAKIEGEENVNSITNNEIDNLFSSGSHSGDGDIPSEDEDTDSITDGEIDDLF